MDLSSILAKKWGILIKMESESLNFTGLEIPRDYFMKGRYNLMIYVGIDKATAHFSGLYLSTTRPNIIPVNRFINAPQKMVLGDHVIHTEHLNLLSFLIRVLSHHRNIPPSFITSHEKEP